MGSTSTRPKAKVPCRFAQSAIRGSSHGDGRSPFSSAESRPPSQSIRTGKAMRCGRASRLGLTQAAPSAKVTRLAGCSSLRESWLANRQDASAVTIPKKITIPVQSPALLELERHEDFGQPLIYQPWRSGECVGEGVRMRKCSVLENPLTRLDMPVGIGIVQERGRKEDCAIADPVFGDDRKKHLLPEMGRACRSRQERRKRAGRRGGRHWRFYPPQNQCNEQADEHRPGQCR